MWRVKKWVLFFLGVAIAWIALRQLYHYCAYPDHVHGFPEEQSTFHIDSSHPSSALVKSGYNYQRTLHLIEQTRLLQKSFNEQFSGIHTKRKIIDIAQSKALLADLYRERVRLHHYFHDLKVHYKGNMPLKKIRTLQHYQKVINNAITDVEAILRRA